jgi:hypothetical protein
MAAPNLKKVQGNSASTTLSSGLASDGTSAPLTSDTNFAGEGMVIMSEGEIVEEYAYATTKGGGALTVPIANRGLEGGSAQTHPSGATIKGVLTADMWNDVIDNILVGHNDDGTHDFAIVYDANTNETLKLGSTASAVNEITITNAATGAFPTISATGEADTGIDFENSEGEEILKLDAAATAVNEITITNAATTAGPVIEATGGDSSIAPTFKGKAAFPRVSGIKDLGTVGATETVNWASGDRQKMTLDENLTITFSNASEGQTLTLYMLQDGSGSNTITFSDTITWADNTTPSWTTTASKMNIAVITYVGSAYYGVGNKFA